MAIPFPTPPTHILGQQIVVHGYSVAVIAHCQCERGSPIQLVSQMTPAGLFSVPTACPQCSRLYAIQRIQQDAAGMLQFSLSCQTPNALKID